MNLETSTVNVFLVLIATLQGWILKKVTDLDNRTARLEARCQIHFRQTNETLD